MGISFSTNRRRRRNNYYHHQQNPHHHHPPPPAPPPAQLISSSTPYSSSIQYPYPSDPPYLTHPPPPYPTHPPLPPPPPIYSTPYYSNAYTTSNYTNNPLMGGSNYRPFYACQLNGWSRFRPPVGMTMAPPPPPPPPPYLQHQQAKKVRNDVNVHKDTLKVEVDELNPDHHLLSFVFDALFDGSFTIFYFAKEESNCRFVPLFPEDYVPVKIPFQKGPRQKFCQPSGTGIDLGFFELDDLSKPSPGEDVFPLVISAETWLPSLPMDEHSDPSSKAFPHMQITEAVLEKINDGPFKVRVIRQILWIDGVRYELRDIYGIGNSAESFNNDTGKDCVICMTEPKDTAVLPCRHMCMCSECAKTLRLLQSNNCPICRQPIEELIEIKIDNTDQ